MNRAEQITAMLNEGVSKALLTKAFKQMQLYLGSNNKARVSDQQKLYKAVTKTIEKLAKVSGMEFNTVWQQAEEYARTKGVVVPVPGRDI